MNVTCDQCSRTYRTSELAGLPWDIWLDVKPCRCGATLVTKQMLEEMPSPMQELEAMQATDVQNTWEMTIADGNVTASWKDGNGFVHALPAAWGPDGKIMVDLSGMTKAMSGVTKEMTKVKQAAAEKFSEALQAQKLVVGGALESEMSGDQIAALLKHYDLDIHGNPVSVRRCS